MDAAEAFLTDKKFKRGNTEVQVHSYGTVMLLHGNEIACKGSKPEPHLITLSNAGWFTKTTKERLNAIKGVTINQKNWLWYLNGEAWDGKPKEVKQ